MGRVRKAASRLILALPLVGCTPSTQPAATTPPTQPAAATPQPPPEAAVEGFVVGQGRGADEAEAYAQALAQLTEALLGDARWPAVVPVVVYDRNEDLYDVVTHDGTTRVAIGLTESRAATALGEFEYAKPAITGPEAWNDALYQAVASHAALVACQRRELLFGVRCQAPQTTEIDTQLSTIGAGVSLTPVIDGGVPVDAEGRTLRQARMLVLWNGAPTSGVPLQVAMPDGTTRTAVSDDAGEVDLPVNVGTAWPGAITTSVDPNALLGPLAEAWPSVSATAEARPVDPKRWALVLEGETPARGVFAQSLRGALEPTLGPPVRLSKRDVDALRSAGPADRARLLVALGDRFAGQLDVVVFASANARFASRAGGSRVWFEASGEVVVHEVWGAGELGRAKKDVTASGVGDRRAGDAARRKLAGAVGPATLTTLGVGSGASGSVSMR
ncbi:MAG: hypothetical protein AAGA54_35200 [Myxococcota bacterium]